MKTLVELYDEDRLKNVLAALMLRPENVIYICHDDQINKKWKQEINDFLIKRKVRATVIFKMIDTHDQVQVEKLLHWIMVNFTDVVFEITGGDDYLINAVGQFCTENKISRVFKDFEDGRWVFLNPEGDASERPLTIPKLNVREVIKMSGGKIIGQNHDTVFGRSKETDLILLRTCKLFLKERKVWQRYIYYLQRMEMDIDGLWASSRVVKLNGSPISVSRNFLEKLEKVGAIEQLAFEGRSFSFKFTGYEVKSLLTDMGSALEMYIYYIAKYKCDFDDVMVSAKIEWTPEDNICIESEIDLIIIKEAQPIFISCKTSLKHDPHLTLYEIKALSEKFGGGINKAVLVTSENMENVIQNIPYRANLLGIKIIDYHTLADEEALIAALNSL